jgi:hypothetical protein
VVGAVRFGGTLNAWLKANAVSLVTAIVVALGGYGGWLVTRARADDRVEQVARDLAADKADLARHAAEELAVREQLRRDMAQTATLLRDLSWNAYFSCTAQATRPDVQCVRPEVPR